MSTINVEVWTNTITITTEAQWPAGPWLPAWGTVWQLLKKNSSTDNDTSWSTITQDNIWDWTTYKQYSQTEKTKLAGIAAWAEVNVNADWNSVSWDSEILNKPIIPDELADLAEDTTHRVVTDTEKSTWNWKQDALWFTPENSANKWVIGWYAELDWAWKVPSAQLPSYVDDVIEVADFASLPVTWETWKIYVTLDTNLTYRWSGTVYVEISASLALWETSATAYRWDRGKAAYDHSQVTSWNPHNVTKTDVWLGNVDNTSDADKPVSSATQTALDWKVDENGAITGATKTKITYDAKWLVTSWADATNADITISKIGSPNIDTVKDITDVIYSTGILWSLPTITDNWDWTIWLPAIEVLIRATNSDTAEVVTSSVSANATLSLTDWIINYIYVEYNAGTPQYVATTQRTDTNTNIWIAKIYRIGTVLHSNPYVGQRANDNLKRISKRFTQTQPFQRVDWWVLSEIWTRNIAITAWNWWECTNAFSTNAFDSSGVGTFSYFYRDGIGWFTIQTAQTQINNTQYDNGTGSLATLTANRYWVHWVYLGTDGHVFVLFGRWDYILSDAQSAVQPSDVPLAITAHGRLCGKIIIQKSAATFTSIESAFESTFELSQITDHWNLTWLTDDDHTQYLLIDWTRAMTGDLAMWTNDITMTGSLGATGARVTKGWLTDLEVTNAIAGSITGNAWTVTNWVYTTDKGIANWVASLDANGLIPITQMPPSAIERMVVVADQAARYALTTATVQNGDTVKQTDTGEMWYVIDDTNLGNSAGYAVYTAGTASAVALSGVTGLGTGVATALAINVGSAGAPVVNGGALGTPSSGTVTNLTGTASININGTVGATTPTTGAFTTATASTSVSTPSIITASGSLGITPAAGSGVNINLSTTGDFAVNTNQLYVDTSEGMVGIGTVTPWQTLEVYKTTNTLSGILINNPNAGDGAAAALQFTSNGGTAQIYRTSTGYAAGLADNLIIQDQGGGDILFYGAGETMRLANGGNVGIGTDSPDYKLEVVQTSTADNQAAVSASHSWASSWTAYGLAASVTGASVTNIAWYFNAVNATTNYAVYAAGGLNYFGTTIDLGHLSDTTISRASAGVIAVEWVAIPTISSTSTLTNKRITQRVASATDDATAVIDSDSYDEYYLTAIANATEITITGTPTVGQTIFIGLKDAWVSKALTWTGITALWVTLPTATTASKQHIIWLKYIGSTWYWVAVWLEA